MAPEQYINIYHVATLWLALVLFVCVDKSSAFRPARLRHHHGMTISPGRQCARIAVCRQYSSQLRSSNSTATNTPGDEYSDSNNHPSLDDNTNTITRIIKHPKPLPISAGFRFLRASSRGQAHHYLTKLMREHGENFIIWNKYVVVNDADAIRDVLETHNLEKTPEVIRGYKSMFYRKGGILAAPWKEWIKQRRMAAPALAEAVIGELIPKFEYGSRPFFDLIQNAAATGKAIEIDQTFQAVTMDIIGLILLGKTFGLGERLLKEEDCGPVPFADALNVVTAEAILQMTLPRWVLMLSSILPSRKLKHARDVIDTFLDECVSARVQERTTLNRDDINNQHAPQNTNTTNVDLLNMLLDTESEGTINMDDVKGQLLTFIFAGHDTTAHTMAWLLWEVSQDVDLQDTLAAEARAALASRDSVPMDREILAKKLPLLDRVWKETNRKHPAAATGTLRVVGNEAIVVGVGLELPPRASVLIPPYSLHRNERYWPDPEVFDPSRFEGEIAASRDPMTFQAFSSGPRNCIGSRLARAEALFILAPLFRQYEVSCVSSEEDDGEMPADYCSLTRKPRDGIFFTFTPRGD